MIKSHMEETITKSKVIDEVTCNMCGEIIKKGKENYDDYLHIVKDFGYFSMHDGESHNFDICEYCYGQIVKQCKIKPTVVMRFGYPEKTE